MLAFSHLFHITFFRLPGFVLFSAWLFLFCFFFLVCFSPCVFAGGRVNKSATWPTRYFPLKPSPHMSIGDVEVVTTLDARFGLRRPAPL